jgi:hypothetical protein
MTANVVHPAELERVLVARVEDAHARRGAPRRRTATHKARRTRRVSVSLLAATLITLAAATAYGAITIVNIEVADQDGYESGMTDEGAIVEYIGDGHTTFGSSGTGTFDSFVRVQANDDERGYNTDGTLEFDTKSGTWTHSILVSEIPVVECESLDGNLTPGGLCWELFADLNESNNTPRITLDAFEIYFTDDPELTGYPFAGTADLVFESDDQIQINDVNQGSGRGDLRYLAPVSGIDIPDECSYGSATCDTYFILYSEYGFADGLYDSDGGFEEWKVKIYPFLSVEKTATTTFTRTFAWDIEKSADPETWDLFDGDSGTSDWTVEVNKDSGTDSDWAVSGTITVTNPSEEDAVIASVTDAISGGLNATVNCGVTFPYELEAGDDLVCTYSRSLPDGTNRTNTATATLDSGQVFTDDAAVTFGDPTTLVNDTVDVTDTNGQSWDDVADDASFTYPETFDCPDDEGTHDNTATITQTGQNDSASVTVECYQLDVTKDADTSFDRTYEWSIVKSADQDDVILMPGQQLLVNYSVTVDVIGQTDDNFAVEGDIVIDNPHPTQDAVLTAVTDVISVGIAATVDCPSLTVPAGGTLTCTYSADLPDGTTRTNTATATQQNYDYDSSGVATPGGTTDYDGSASVDFSAAEINEIDECIDVNDTIAGFLGTVCVDDVPAPPKTFTYSEFVGPYTVEECGEHDVPNTADFLTNDTGATDESSWNVHVTIPCPLGCTLTQGYWKTHNESFHGGAPADPNWALIGDFDGDGLSELEGEAFFGTGQTWFEVFWTPVSGKPYYQLAHQWMAAYINALSIADLGGTIPASVQDALDDGAAFLDTHDVNKDLKGKDAKAIKAEAVALAGILADFNEGLTGPGHCDEDSTSALTATTTRLVADVRASATLG